MARSIYARSRRQCQIGATRGIPARYACRPIIYFSRAPAADIVHSSKQGEPVNQLPVFLNLDRQPCLVVGGGAVAGRKVTLLQRAGARVRVVAPELGEALSALRVRGTIEHVAGAFEFQHLRGMRLVIAATDDPHVNRAVAEAADGANVPCNVVDDNQASSFIMPAIVDRSPVVVAIGTGGNAPVLAQQLKSKIEAWLPPRIGRLAAFAGRWREAVKQSFATMQERRRYWQQFFEGPIAEHVLADRERKAEGLARRSLIHRVVPRKERSGEAYIVGAGPGDPGLVTIRAQQLIRQADVVLYDRLVTPEVLDFARKEADLIPVGKAPGDPSDRQDGINRLLVELVREGKRVCRLKGGDPFIFGRGGEEARALQRAGLPYQIVPGISAALGCAAYAGIPLTMRGMSASVTFATAKLGGTSAPDWGALVRSGQTLALYMSAGSVDDTAAGLLQQGLDGATPAAIVENGTTPRQRALHSTLAEIGVAANAAGIIAPAMLFIGATVALGRELQWFDAGDASEEGAGVAHPDTFSGLPARA